MHSAGVSRIRSQRPKLLLLLEYALYRCFECFFRYLSPVWVDRIGMAMGLAAFHLMKKRRAIVERNVRIAWGDVLNRQEFTHLTKQVFQRNGANLLGGTRCMVMDDQVLQKHFSLEGAEQVREHLAKGGSGVIFALCHMGNWEILARIAHLIAPGAPAGAFYRPLNNPWMNRMTKRRRQRSGTILFSNKEGLTQACPLLRSGGVLGILADQYAGRTGCLSTFFGRPTSCSPLVELLHRRTGAAVFYIAMARDAPAHWQIKITAHPADLVIDTPRVMGYLEKSLSQSPADGFWFHNRWKLPRRAPLQTQHSRSSVVPSDVTKPWRWLIVESSNTTVARAARPALHYAIAQAPHAEITMIAQSMPDFPCCFFQRDHTLTNLVALVEDIESEKSYPLDILLWIAPVEEGSLQGLGSRIPFIAAIARKGHAHVSFPVDLNGALDEESTWWEFFHRLGIARPTEQK